MTPVTLDPYIAGITMLLFWYAGFKVKNAPKPLPTPRPLKFVETKFESEKEAEKRE
jgi:hypothetical protein